MTDGYKLVIGHHSQEETIQTPKKHKKGHLCQAACIGDDPAVSLNVQNHFQDCGGDEIDVSQGWVGEEKVHGSVEVGVRGDSQDDEQVPQHSDQLCGQEQDKEQRLQFWIT